MKLDEFLNLDNKTISFDTNVLCIRLDNNTIKQTLRKLELLGYKVIISSVVLSEIEHEGEKLLHKKRKKELLGMPEKARRIVAEAYDSALEITKKSYGSSMEILKEEREIIEPKIGSFQRMMSKVAHSETPVVYHEDGRYSGFKDYLIADSISAFGDVIFVTENQKDFETAPNFKVMGC